MLLLSFNITEILNEVLTRIEYISGKRAHSTGEYFTLTACEADKGLLRQLISEAAASILASVSPRSGIRSVEADNINLELSPRPYFTATESRNTAIRLLLRELVICETLLRWFRISGLPDQALFETNCSRLQDKLYALLNLRQPLRPRQYPPI